MPKAPSQHQSPDKKHRRGLDHPTPHFDNDDSIRNLSKVEARKVNEKRIKDILEVLAPPQPTQQTPHHRDHPVGRPMLNLGQSNTKDAGGWYQLVSSMTL